MLKITPIMSAALGGAAVYYGGNRLWMLVLLAPVWAVGAAACGPSCFFGDAKSRRRFRILEGHLIGLLLGCCLGLCAGVSRPVRLGLPADRIIGFTGILQEDPRSLPSGGARGTLALLSTAGHGGVRASARGSLAVEFPEEALPRLKEFGRGSLVYIEARRFRAQSVHIIAPAPKLEQLRAGIREYVIQRFAGPEWGGLAVALLLGVKDTLDTDLARAYRDAGCSHILALSGMHLAVIAGILGFALKKPFGIKAAGVISIGCIIGYAYLVGNLPSLHRAAIMYVLGVLGVLVSLPKTPMPLLALTFLIQLCLEPESGRSISFILSYLSLGGILSISVIIYDLIRGRVPKTPAQSLSASLGAFIATAPCSALFFGVLRPVGIIAGIIAAPLTLLFMLGGMLFLAAHGIAPFLVPVLELFLSGVYAILGRVISLCAFVPGVSAGFVPVLLGSVGVSVLCILLYIRAKRSRYASFD